MNCPCCGSPMESGRLETQAIFHLLRHPASICFLPDDPYGKKQSSSPLCQWEGWYCPHCRKIIGIFDAK